MDSSQSAGIHCLLRYGSAVPLVPQAGDRQVFSSERNFRSTTYNGRPYYGHAHIASISISSEIFQHESEDGP